MVGPIMNRFLLLFVTMEYNDFSFIVARLYKDEDVISPDLIRLIFFNFVIYSLV